jgi:hypothetical protein
MFPGQPEHAYAKAVATYELRTCRTGVPCYKLISGDPHRHITAQVHIRLEFNTSPYGDSTRIIVSLSSLGIFR